MINKVQSTNSFGMGKKIQSAGKKTPTKPKSIKLPRVPHYTKDERAAVTTMQRVIDSLPELLKGQFARGIRGCI
jgi:hypothetical protein